MSALQLQLIVIWILKSNLCALNLVGLDSLVQFLKHKYIIYVAGEIFDIVCVRLTVLQCIRIKRLHKFSMTTEKQTNGGEDSKVPFANLNEEKKNREKFQTENLK